MAGLSDVSIRRPVFATMLVLALVVVGAASYFKLGVDRFPPVDMPTVRVATRLPGASPMEVETEVSQIIEENVNTVQGIRELRSISGPGQSMVLATFELNVDIDTAAQDVRDRVAGAIRDLPREADPPVVNKFDPDQSAVLILALAGERSLRELTELADKIVKVQIERAPGVAEVEINGGLQRSISIWIDSRKLASHGIPITEVRDSLIRQNSNVPGGNVTGDLQESTLRTLGRVRTPEEFNELVVATVNGTPVRVRDIGRAEDGTKEQRSIARLNGVPTVTLEIKRQSGVNTIEVIEGVKSKLKEVQALLPGDVKIDVMQDQSVFIYNALHEITLHLIVGSILASLVVLLFMRNWRAMIIAAVAIPASVISAFAMMQAMNFTLNSVTMLALVLMVGVVIDDAIVVLENIFRFIEEKKLSPFEAARQGTSEIALAVMATTLSLVVIFVPVSFMSSISGRFLFQFGITAAVAVLVSLLVSFTLTPMMSARFFRSIDSGGAAKSRGGFYHGLESIYLALLRFALRHKAAMLVLAFLISVSSYPLYKMVRQEYIPGNVDEGEFEARVNAVEGASLPTMNEASEAIEAELRTLPGVRTVLASIGGGGFMGSIHQARFYIKLAPHEERIFSLGRLFRATLAGKPFDAFKGNYSQQEIMVEARKRLKKFPDLRGGVSNISNFAMGGSRWEIEFVILGPDIQELARLGEELRLRCPEIGIVDADTTLRLNRPELRVEIDRERAGALGVDTEHIASALRLLVGGDERVTRYYDPAVNDSYDVQIRLAEEERQDASSIGRLFVPNRDGELVRLDNIVKIVPAQVASRIDRLDRQRQVSVRASVAPGFALADRLEALQAEMKKIGLPAGYTTRISGRGRELDTTFNEFLWAFALSIVFMYMILAAQFESVVHPFTILVSLPLCLPFALFSIWATNTTLNLYSALGLLVLFGIVKKNAILQIDHMNKLIEKGVEHYEAIIEANRDRLRPILMTTLTLIAGMLPLALGAGPGAEERRTIAVVVIGGQALSLLVTLIVTPVVYSVIDQWREKFRGRARSNSSWPRPEAIVPARQTPL